MDARVPGTEGTRRIALVIRGLGGRSGGAEKVFCELANKLAALGHEVTCHHYDNGLKPVFHRLDPRVVRRNLLGPRRVLLAWLILALMSVRHLGLFAGRLKWIERHWLFSRLLVRQLGRDEPDLIISFMPFANTASLMAGRAAGIPVIACNHNVPRFDYEHASRWDNRFSHCRKQQLAWLDQAAAIHVLFAHFRDFFPAHLRARMVAIPNFIDIEPAPESTPREDIILAVGRLVPVKNIALLAKAWLRIHARHPGWRVRVLGEGPERAAIAAVLAGHPEAAARFELAGVSRTMACEYQRASLFCHPALYEGFGLAPAEALKMGLPVVGFADCEGMNQYVRDGRNGLMVERASGAEGLAEALSALIDDAPLRQRLAAAAPGSVAGFSAEAFVENWAALIERVCGARVGSELTSPRPRPIPPVVTGRGGHAPARNALSVTLSPQRFPGSGSVGRETGRGGPSSCNH